MGNIFLGLFLPINRYLNATALYNSIDSSALHGQVDLFTNGYFQHDNMPCHKAEVFSNWFHKHDNELPSQSPGTLNPEYLYNVCI